MIEPITSLPPATAAEKKGMLIHVNLSGASAAVAVMESALNKVSASAKFHVRALQEIILFTEGGVVNLMTPQPKKK